MASTAEQLRARRAVVQSAGGRVSRRRMPQQTYPSGARLRYQRELFAVIDGVRRLAGDMLIPRLPAIVAEAEMERGGIRQDTAVEVVTRTFSDMRLLLGAATSEEAIGNFARGLGDEVNVHNRRQVQAQFKAVLGVELLEAEKALGPVTEAFVAENVSLIKSVPADLMDDLERTVLRDVRAGLRVEVIQKNLVERFGVSESRAALIARDQVGKLNGQLTRHRHQNVGINSYEWSTSNDERVRKRHDELDGTTQDYNNPPIVDKRTGRTGNPGDDYQCRCNAIPIFPEELLEAAGITEQPAQVTKKAKPAPTGTDLLNVTKAVLAKYKGRPAAPTQPFSAKRLADAVVEDAAIKKGIPARAAEGESFEAFLKRRQVALDAAAASGEPVRRELNNLFAELGLVSQDVLQNRSGSAKVLVRKLGRYVQAAHSFDGRIILRPAVYRSFQAAVRKLAKGQKLTEANTDALEAMIHEVTHAHSPMRGIKVYRGAGVRLEEATTEIAARRITEGVTKLPGHYQVSGTKGPGAAYNGEIESLKAATAKVRGLDRAPVGFEPDASVLAAETELHEFVTEAALRMRKTDRLFDTPRDYAAHYLSGFPEFKARAVAARKKGAERSKAFGTDRAASEQAELTSELAKEIETFDAVFSVGRKGF